MVDAAFHSAKVIDLEGKGIVAIDDRLVVEDQTLAGIALSQEWHSPSEENGHDGCANPLVVQQSLWVGDAHSFVRLNKEPRE